MDIEAQNDGTILWGNAAALVMFFFCYVCVFSVCVGICVWTFMFMFVYESA